MSMDAVIYKGEREVAVEAVEEPQIQHPNDVIIDITTTCIYGSNLHMYEGRTAAELGIMFGYENMDIVGGVGDAVSSLEVGNCTVAPFNVICGSRENCENGCTGFCTNVDPGFAGGAYGYVTMGPHQGGQVEKLCTPYADFDALRLPDGREHEDSFALLADILPTGWYGTRLVNLESGGPVVAYGADPVGLMAVYSARLKGVVKIHIVDHVPSRLALAGEHCDATPINFEGGDPVEQIGEIHGDDADKGVDTIGYQVIDPEKEADSAYDPVRGNPAVVINDLIRTVRSTGEFGIPGLYVPDDPSAPNEVAAQDRLGIDFGLLFKKG